MSYMIDTNILVYMSNSSDPLHAVSQNAVNKLLLGPELLYIIPQIMVEFWRVATSPSRLGWSVSQATAALQMWEATFTLIAETPDVYIQWRLFCAANNITNTRTHDARIAATMLLHGIEKVLTVNVSDFAGWPQITPVLPQAI